MTTLPATIDLNPPGNNPKGSIIWMHGLGADANDFVPMVEQLNLLEGSDIRFVFPNAPIRPITINAGMNMRAWYDIFELNLSAKEDLEGIESSQKLINSLIEREIHLGISSENIVIGGFSQGGAMALYAGLRYSQKLAGVIALSTYLPLAKMLNAQKHAMNEKIPIFMAHGLFDPIVPLMLGEMTHQQLAGLGYAIEWHTYSMPHTVVAEEIKDIAKFLENTLTRP